MQARRRCSCLLQLRGRRWGSHTVMARSGRCLAVHCMFGRRESAEGSLTSGWALRAWLRLVACQSCPCWVTPWGASAHTYVL